MIFCFYDHIKSFCFVLFSFSWIIKKYVFFVYLFGHCVIDLLQIDCHFVCFQCFVHVEEEKNFFFPFPSEKKPVTILKSVKEKKKSNKTHTHTLKSVSGLLCLLIVVVGVVVCRRIYKKFISSIQSIHNKKFIKVKYYVGVHMCVCVFNTNIWLYERWT